MKKQPKNKKVDEYLESVRQQYAKDQEIEKIKQGELDNKIREAGIKVLINDPATFGVDPAKEIKLFVLNYNIYSHVFSPKAKRIYETKIDNTVCEVTEEILRTKGENHKVRNANLVYYFQFLVEYSDDSYNLKKDIVNMAKCFNYLVENGFADFGVFQPISRLPLSKLSFISNEMLFMFIVPSKYLSLRIDLDIKKGLYKNHIDALNGITGLPYWYKEGEIPELKDWSALESLLVDSPQQEDTNNLLSAMKLQSENITEITPKVIMQSFINAIK